MGKTTRTILTLGAIGLVAYLLYKNKKGKKNVDIVTPPPPPTECPTCGKTKCDDGFHTEQVGECGCKCVADVVIFPPPPQDDSGDDDIVIFPPPPQDDSGDDIVLFPHDEVIDTPNYDGYVLHATNYGFITKGVLRLFLSTSDFQSFFKESLGKDFSKVINVTDEFFNSFPKGEDMPSNTIVVTPTDEEPLGGGGIKPSDDNEDVVDNSDDNNDTHPAPPQGCHYDANWNLICNDFSNDGGGVFVEGGEDVFLTQ